ncbi:MAG TPA: hypothetical protein VGK73_00095 [Polyangiaceae bacterium]
MFEWFNVTLPVGNSVGVKDIAVLGVTPNSTGIDLRTLFGNRGRDMPTGSYTPTGLVPDPKIAAPSGLPNIDAGHYYTIQADSAGVVASGAVNPWRVYFNLTPNVQAVSESVVGNGGSGACWAIVDGQSLRGRLVGMSQDRASGFATGMLSTTLNFKCPPNSGTGYLRIYRSSIGDGRMPGDEWPGPGIRF